MSSNMTRPTESRPGVVLDVAIIGAGIAGLGAAIGLRHAGHQVEIFERSNFSNEVGAAVNVCPNASRILTKWGFDWERSKALIVVQHRSLDARTMKHSYHGRYEDLAARFGAPWYFVHRVDLHTELKRLAQNLGVKLRLGCEIVDVDCDRGVITLPTGQTLQKDLIIAADGVHVMNGADTKVSETGQSAFRFMIPMEKLQSAGLVEPLFIDNDACITIAAHPARRLVWYPCRGGELLNLVAIHPDRKAGDEIEAWNIAGRLNDLLDEYKDFHPDLVKVCGAAEDLNVWKLFYRPPIRSWFKGKLALSGDAAHPMLPHQGQGAGQAIEDAGALSVIFSSIESKEDVTPRLQIYEDVRKTRAASIQVLSNAGQDEAEKVRAEAQKYINGKVPTNQAEFQVYNFQHDVMQEAEKVMSTRIGGTAAT